MIVLLGKVGESGSPQPYFLILTSRVWRASSEGAGGTDTLVMGPNTCLTHSGLRPEPHSEHACLRWWGHDDNLNVAHMAIFDPVCAKLLSATNLWIEGDDDIDT
jgi:hypothetical protein